MTRGRVLVLVVGLALVVAGVGVWLWRGAEVSVDAAGDRVQTVPRTALPVFADSADLRTLYRFAADHADLLRYMPCTCGCADIGHTSNYSCYVKGETADRVTFTSHAAT